MKPSTDRRRRPSGMWSDAEFRLVDLVLSAGVPSEAIRRLEGELAGMERRWDGELTLGEAGAVVAERAAAQALLADLRRSDDRRRGAAPWGERREP